MSLSSKTTRTPALLACGLLAAAAWALPAIAAQPEIPTDLRAELQKAQSAPELTQAAVRHGGKVAAFCANCHGDQGNSLHADTPNLAGQNPTYLLDQMLKFGAGARKHEFMQRLINAMSTEEKVGTALYYARQPVTTQTKASAAEVAKGKSYYARLCFRCHGADGHGDETYARLAGQQERYVIYALKRYREGSAVRQDPLMAENTRLMSDADIQAVAAYIATMK